ncbi:MAG: acyl carrier protein [Maritimibacter sp.]
MASDIQSQTIEILAKQARVEPGTVTLDMSLEDLGLDSMALVEALFVLEERFEVSVPFNANQPEEQGVDLSTVGAVVVAVEGLVKGRG